MKKKPNFLQTSNCDKTKSVTKLKFCKKKHHDNILIEKIPTVTKFKL